MFFTVCVPKQYIKFCQRLDFYYVIFYFCNNNHGCFILHLTIAISEVFGCRLFIIPTVSCSVCVVIFLNGSRPFSLNLYMWGISMAWIEVEFLQRRLEFASSRILNSLLDVFQFMQVS